MMNRDIETNYNLLHPSNALVSLLKVESGYTNDKGEVYDKNGLFIDFPRELGSKQRDDFDRSSIAKKLSKKTVLSLVHERGNYSYYHWTYETLPKLIYLSQNRDQVKIDNIYFHCGFFGHPYQRQALKRLGFKSWQLLDAGKDKSLTAKEIIAIRLNTERLNPTFELCQMIKSTFIKNSSVKPFRKIYLTREQVKTGRKVINELPLRELLTSHGFQIVVPDGMSLEAQAKLFNESKFIISPHGAALANIAFCEPGTKILELFNQLDQSTWSPLYSKIAQTCGLDLVSLAPAQVEKEGESHHRSGFYADLDSIKANLTD
jgi:capsular polysaccharide biosynthesis protein